MQYKLLESLRCPVTRSPLTLQVISEKLKVFDEGREMIVEEGILFSEKDWFYPIIKGIPRLCVESFLDYPDFLNKQMFDYNIKASNIKNLHPNILEAVIKKNKRTKESFTKEWGLFDYEKDKTWGVDGNELVERFYLETNENAETLKDKIVLDAGCGNGKLNYLLGKEGIQNIGMDFSTSIEAAQFNNRSKNTHFIQGDVQFPPVAFRHFDLIHSSGVLIATNNTELSFSCLTPALKDTGKFSVWLYQPSKDFIHNSFNVARNLTSKLPLSLKRILYSTTVFPVSYVIKKIKGNKQNSREMMIDILDWFTPEFRWEHTQEEVAAWFQKRSFRDVKVTQNGLFGYNIIGILNLNI